MSEFHLPVSADSEKQKKIRELNSLFSRLSTEIECAKSVPIRIAGRIFLHSAAAFVRLLLRFKKEKR